MSVKRGSLGRNLSALLSPGSDTLLIEEAEARLSTLKLEQLKPGKYQPRREMDEEALIELSGSIKKQGLLQPLLARKLPEGGYEIIAGERRWRACKLAGLTEVPVLVREVDDETAMAMALVENLQRENLNAMDEARAMHRLTTEFALTHQQVADLLSKSRAAVSNYLRLLHLHADVMRMLENGDIDMGHARALLVLDTTQQSEAAKLISAKQLSVREAEVLVARIKAGRLQSAPKTETAPFCEQELLTLAKQWQTKISVKEGKAGKGSLVIQYTNKDMLEKMLSQLLH